MKIEIVPCLRDNYAYLLSHEGSNEVAVVDPSEAAPVLFALGSRRLVAILATHHHADHVGGNEDLVAQFPDAKVYGHAAELHGERRIPAQTVGVSDDQTFSLLGWSVQGIHIPGHTRTAVAYYFPRAEALFTGDTLFGAGCGRLFEGTPKEMHTSLKRLIALPPSTRVYCGHEYTKKNLEFAAHIEPQSEAIAQRQAQVTAQRAQEMPTIPFALADESATNPFVRTSEPTVIAAMSRRPAVAQAELDAVEVLARLRRWKDEF